MVGEARQRGLSREALLAANPSCIYCAGMSPATTIDHMPPRIVFSGKLRPRQFEFPSCDGCNQGTKATDQFIAWVSRMYPDAHTEPERTEVRKILRGLSNNMPDVLREMEIGTAGQKLARKRTGIQYGGGFLRMDGPLVSRHLDIFGCKLGLAMHWEFTRQIVPLSGGVVVRYVSNVQAMQGKVPTEFLKLLPGPQTLRQGSWDVANQFRFSARTTNDKTMGLFYATFRSSFGLAAVTTMDQSLLSGEIGPALVPGAAWSKSPA
jgi:hypothetical protein